MKASRKDRNIEKQIPATCLKPPGKSMKPEPSGWFSKYSLPNNLTTLCQSTNSYVENQSILFTNAILLSLLHFYKGKQRAMTANMTSCPILYDTLSIARQGRTPWRGEKNIRTIVLGDSSPQTTVRTNGMVGLIQPFSLYIIEGQAYLYTRLDITYVSSWA